MVVVDGGDVPTLRRGHVIFLRTILNTQGEETNYSLADYYWSGRVGS